MDTLKIGLMVDDKFARKYVYELADWAQKQAGVEISHLIICPPPANSTFKKLAYLIRKFGFYYLASTLLFRGIISVEKLFLKLNKMHKSHFDVFDLGEKVSNKIVIQPTISRFDPSYQFSSNDVRRVEDLKLDLLIQCGSGVLRGGILNACRLGIISFDEGTHRIYEGCPTGFWECYYRNPKTGFIIRKLTDDADAGDVLLHGFFSTRYFFILNHANVCKRMGPHFKNLLQRISLTGELPQAAVLNHDPGRSLESPKFHHGIFYVFMITCRVAKKVIIQCISLKQRWGISFVRSDWKQVALPKSIVAKVPKGHFWADPFVYSKNGKTYCFVEDYVYKTNRGHISVVEITEDSTVKLGDCIREPFHLSFPFLFKYDGSLYMCPESSESKQIRIYRCTDFPLSWELSSVIMDEVSAADSVLFERAGMWWMLTSIDKSGSNDYCSELYLFYSGSPLDANWKAHPQNPIRIDSEGGRNAGLIMEEGKVFRLAQRQGYDQYGEGLLMYEIIELSETTYTERLFSRIDPSFRKGVLGTHHLSTTGTVTVFDHVSHSFFP